MSRMPTSAKLLSALTDASNDCRHFCSTLQTSFISRQQTSASSCQASAKQHYQGLLTDRLLAEKLFNYTAQQQEYEAAEKRLKDELASLQAASRDLAAIARTIQLQMKCVGSTRQKRPRQLPPEAQCPQCSISYLQEQLQSSLIQELEDLERFGNRARQLSVTTHDQICIVRETLEQIRIRKQEIEDCIRRYSSVSNRDDFSNNISLKPSCVVEAPQKSEIASVEEHQDFLNLSASTLGESQNMRQSIYKEMCTWKSSMLQRSRSAESLFRKTIHSLEERKSDLNRQQDEVQADVLKLQTNVEKLQSNCEEQFCRRKLVDSRISMLNAGQCLELGNFWTHLEFQLNTIKCDMKSGRASMKRLSDILGQLRNYGNCLQQLHSTVTSCLQSEIRASQCYSSGPVDGIVSADKTEN